MRKGLELFVRLTIILFLTITLPSCAQQEISKEVSGSVFIEAIPFEITAESGEHLTIWVTVMDSKRKPLPNVLVQAESDTPSRALVTPESLLTNDEGVAIFTVTGISHMPSRAHITFTTDGLSAEVRTILIVL